MTAPTAAGWYDDPDNANAQRYWDGHNWTPRRQRKPASSPPPARASAPIAERPPIHEEYRAAYEPVPEFAPPAPSRKRLTTTTLLIGAVVVLVVALALAIGVHALTKHQPTASPPTAAMPPPAWPTPMMPRFVKPRETVLPFTGITQTQGLAVDSAGTLYVADTNDKRVVKLAAGASTQEVLPFTGLGQPWGVAADGAGNVYVTDDVHGRVLKLAAGSSAQEVLPITSSNVEVAVDSAGTVYACTGGNEVHKLAAGSSAEEVLPITNTSSFLLAVDAAGSNIYVTGNGKGRVAKLAVR